MLKNLDTPTSDRIGQVLYISAVLFLLLNLQQTLEQTMRVWLPLANGIVTAVAGVYLWPLYRNFKWWTFPVLITIGVVFGLVKGLAPLASTNGQGNSVVATSGTIVAMVIAGGLAVWIVRGRKSHSH
jgi:hypothetical protein